MIHRIDIALGPYPLWFALVLTAVVLFSVVMFYRRVGRTVGRRTLWLLAGLRLLAMVALLLCLFRPEITFQRMQARRHRLFMLADTSKSMSIRDYAKQQEDRLGTVTATLLEADGVAEQLDDTFTLEWFAFDSHARALKRPQALQRLEPDGMATDLATSIAGAVGNTGPEEVAGAIVFTDGIDNSVGDTIGRLAALGVRVFPVGVGSRLSDQPNYKDVAIEHVEHSRTVPLDTSAEITCFIRAVGYGDRVAPLVLKRGEEEVAREDVVLKAEGAEQKVTLRYRPRERGEQELTAAIRPLADERILENNQATFHIFVSEPTIKVLYVAGHVRPEFGAVRRALEFDPNVAVIALVRTVGSRFLQMGDVKGVRLDGFPATYDDLRPFRVVILGNLAAEHLTADQMGHLARLVKEEGAGLMMVGGKASFGPGGYAGTPVEDVLPVYCGGRQMGQEGEPFLLTLTPAGMNHPIFAGVRKYFRPDDPAAGVPRLLGCSVVPGPKPGATVLAVNPNRANENGPLVAVAVGRFGNGRAMAATIDTTYQWDIPMRGMGRESPFVKYWGQSVRWLAGKDDLQRAARPLVAYPDKHFCQVGAKPRLIARVTDERGQATNMAVVRVTLRREADEQVSRHQLPYVQGTRGEYEAELSPPEPGKYAVTVAATLDGQPVGEEAFTFRVGEPDKEFEKLDLNEELLKEIARRTKGRYHTLLGVEQLADTLREDAEKTLVTHFIRLWNSPFLFLAIVLLVTTEWIVRRQRYLV